ncbi:MAG: fumarylacetoacetase [Planctomycetaceae bacterium]|nr:fumarylacetoacetase [Planctomycetaceae bacterium]
MRVVDHTHDPQARSWIDSANSSAAEFPPQNLPLGVFQAGGLPRIGVAIGDRVICLGTLAAAGLFSDPLGVAIHDHVDLTGLMSLAVEARTQLRRQLFELVTNPQSRLATDIALQQAALHRLADVQMLKPVEVGDYTDFYASLYHATNVGSMFRPDNPLLPNWKHLPIGYHGRASSLVVSGTEIRRPHGQLPSAQEGAAPTFGPCRQLDYELEVGAYIALGNRLGEPISLGAAEDYLFGITLVNDWSARDMQRWEYQPLGPFLAKSFATSVSPWVVTMEALAPFRAPAFERAADDPAPLPYLQSPGNAESGGIQLQLEVSLLTDAMRQQGLGPQRLSLGSFGSMYWTLAQMLTHHTSNGCNMQPGDLIASGTVSGPTRQSRGCLLELTWDGECGKPVPGTQRTPLKFPTGEERLFLAAGDEVVIRGWCEHPQRRTIHLGECRGRVI